MKVNEAIQLKLSRKHKKAYWISRENPVGRFSTLPLCRNPKTAKETPHQQLSGEVFHAQTKEWWVESGRIHAERKFPFLKILQKAQSSKLKAQRKRNEMWLIFKTHLAPTDFEKIRTLGPLMMIEGTKLLVGTREFSSNKKKDKHDFVLL